MENQLVIFDLADEHYGVDIAAVEGIIKMQAITAVPHAPDFVEGVTNLRGEVLPVIDLRKRFSLHPSENVAETRLPTPPAWLYQLQDLPYQYHLPVLASQH